MANHARCDREQQYPKHHKIIFDRVIQLAKTASYGDN